MKFFKIVIDIRKIRVSGKRISGKGKGEEQMRITANAVGLRKVMERASNLVRECYSTQRMGDILVGPKISLGFSAPPNVETKIRALAEGIEPGIFVLGDTAYLKGAADLSHLPEGEQQQRKENIAECSDITQPAFWERYNPMPRWPSIDSVAYHWVEFARAEGDFTSSVGIRRNTDPASGQAPDPEMIGEGGEKRSIDALFWRLSQEESAETSPAGKRKDLIPYRAIFSPSSMSKMALKVLPGVFPSDLMVLWDDLRPELWINGDKPTATVSRFSAVLRPTIQSTGDPPTQCTGLNWTFSLYLS